MKHVLVHRRDAAQATLDRFFGQPFAWGKADCVRVAAFHLRQMGYQPGLIRGGTYSSERGAVRALKRAGFDRLEAAVEALGLIRIPYAAHLTADLVGLESGGEWPSLAVTLGNGRVLTSSAELGVWGVAEPAVERVRMCWQVHPCPRP